MKFTLDTKSARLVADALEFMEPTGETPDPAKELCKAIRAALALEDAGIPGVEFEIGLSSDNVTTCPLCEGQHSQDDDCFCSCEQCDPNTGHGIRMEEPEHDDTCECDQCDPFNFKKHGIC